MYSKTITVINSAGLHARPAQRLVMSAKQFKSELTLCREGEAEPANVKSIMALLSKGISQNTKVVLSAEGEDERLAVDTLAAMIESGFAEE